MPSPELKALLELRWANRYRPELSIEELRGTGDDPGSEPRIGTQVESCDANGVYGEWVELGTPTTGTVFMFLHGGGYYRSSAKASRRIASALSQACGCRCFTVDYRLAPEHPFPAALEDALSAYHWLKEQEGSARKIIVGGSSAGGGLTAALLAKLKSLGECQPAAAILLSPWTDLTQSAKTFETNAELDPTISKAYLDRFAKAYLSGEDPRHPFASPYYSALGGFPPLLIQGGKSETMFGDAVAFAHKARDAGVEVVFEAYDDVPHGWQNSDHVVLGIPETLEAIDRISKFFRIHCI